jgi:sarcosine oxidase gamma subunit
VTGLEFLSRAEVPTDVRPVARSPLGRALREADAGLVEDISLSVGMLEVRGEIAALAVKSAEVVRLTPDRAIVLCDAEKSASILARLRKQGYIVIDMWAAYAGLRLRSERLLRRLTDLDPEALPAVGALAHVQALVFRDDGDTFRIFFPQEYGHYVAEVAADAARGLNG